MEPGRGPRPSTDRPCKLADPLCGVCGVCVCAYVNPIACVNGSGATKRRGVSAKGMAGRHPRAQINAFPHTSPLCAHGPSLAQPGSRRRQAFPPTQLWTRGQIREALFCVKVRIRFSKRRLAERQADREGHAEQPAPPPNKRQPVVGRSMFDGLNALSSPLACLPATHGSHSIPTPLPAHRQAKQGDGPPPSPIPAAAARAAAIRLHSISRSGGEEG